MKTVMRGAVLAAASALVLAACGAAPSESSSSSASGSSTESASSSAAAASYKACMVSDSGGFNDKSFNQSGAEGLDKAAKDLGVTEVKVESKAAADFTPNIDNLLSQNCNLIIGVGFLLEDPIQTAADANKDINFALVDSSFSDKDFKPVTLANAKPLLFNTQEAAYLAGYVAAGMSKSHTIATFGGIQLPSVTIFMDGFVDGAAAYDKDNSTTTKVLGWDKAGQTGVFTGDFEDQTKGKNTAQGFIDQGADIILPVAGPVGLGAAAAAKDGGAMIVGVDADWYNTAPDYKSIVLTSIIKQIGTSVYDTVKQSADGKYTADPYVGTLANGGVDIAPFHDFDSKVPQALKDKVADLKKQIIAGTLKVESPSSN